MADPAVPVRTSRDGVSSGAMTLSLLAVLVRVIERWPAPEEVSEVEITWVDPSDIEPPEGAPHGN